MQGRAARHKSRTKGGREVLSVANVPVRPETRDILSPVAPFVPEDAAAALTARLELVPTSGWHVRARVIMGSATFFDAFNALSIAFVLPVLVPLWHIAVPQI